MKPLHKIIAGLALLIGLAGLTAGEASALVAANTEILNQATLSYWDGSATRTSTSEAIVKVALVPSTPVIIPGPPGITPYNGPGTTLNNTFTVRSSANGPDTYDLTTTVSASTNTSGPTATITTSTQIVLGATVTLSGSTALNLVVPADGTANNSVNGIEQDDFVSINNARYEVASVTDNLTGTSTITLKPAPPLAGGAPAAGVPILEEQDVSVAVTAGTLQSSGTDITVDKTLTAKSITDPRPEETSTAIRDTFTSGTATLVKYVRNVSQASIGTGAFAYGGSTYYRSGVLGSSNQTLEYLLVANNASAADVTQAVITDNLPITFVTIGSNVTYVDENAVSHALTTTSGDDAATYANPTLTVNVGGAIPPIPPAAGGTIPGGNRTVYVIYRVTINP